MVWSVNFKGQFRLGNARYCYPLTVQDAYSRYLLACDGLEGPLLQPTQWNRRWVNVSHILATLPVGLEPLSSGTWNVFFGPVHLGWLDERDYRIHGRRGRALRERRLSPIR